MSAERIAASRARPYSGWAHEVIPYLLDALERAERTLTEYDEAAAFEAEAGGCLCRTCMVAAGEGEQEA